MKLKLKIKLKPCLFCVPLLKERQFFGNKWKLRDRPMAGHLALTQGI